MVELRPGVADHYKSFFYCASKEEAQTVSKIVSDALKQHFPQSAKIIIKHGCTEYYEKFPEFSSLESDTFMELRTDKWDKLETDFNSQNQVRIPVTVGDSVMTVSLLEFLIIKNWWAYATAMNDPSCERLRLSQLNPSVIAAASTRAQNYPLV